MTTKQWKAKRAVPYTGYNLGGDSFAWSAVERIEQIRIHPDTLQASFVVFFISGEVLTYSYSNYILEPDVDTTRTVGIFCRKHPTIRNVQHYFDRNCEKLQELTSIRARVCRAFYKYRRNVARAAV